MLNDTWKLALPRAGVIALLIACGSVGGCDSNDVGDAADNAADAVDDAADATGDAVDDAVDEVEDAVDDAGG